MRSPPTFIVLPALCLGLVGCPALLSDDFRIAQDAAASETGLFTDVAADDASASPDAAAGRTSRSGDDANVDADDARAAYDTCQATCNGCCQTDGTCLRGTNIVACGQRGFACFNCDSYGAYCDSNGECSTEPDGAPAGWDSGRGCLPFLGCPTSATDGGLVEDGGGEQ
jgi:hypothetical protein